MSQTAYNFNPPIARAGLVAEMREGNVIISKLASGTVEVGKLVAPGTHGQVGPSATTADPQSATPGQVKTLVEAETDPIDPSQWIGVSLYDASRPPYTSSNEFSDKDPVMILRKGVVWVTVPDAAVTQFGDVFVWIDPDGSTTYTLGTFLAGANG